MGRFLSKIWHLWQRILYELKRFPSKWHNFGFKIAVVIFIDGIIPPGKSEKYIKRISQYVDNFFSDLVMNYKNTLSAETCLQKKDDALTKLVWCCWWQGEERMPELVKLCYTRLKQLVSSEEASLHLITLENYSQYVNLPEHIIKKFNNGTITMTTMSDILRFHLLERYGGYWVDATVFFTGKIPEEYFSGNFYCQRMVSNTRYSKREACGCNWCGFSIAGPKGNIVFKFMKDAFSEWWMEFDDIIDYVLIDYILLTGFKYIPSITKIINKVPDNNEDIFEMYKVLNQPFSKELFQKLTKRNVMHKLTYKIDLKKQTDDGKMTLYGYLDKCVYENNGIFY